MAANSSDYYSSYSSYFVFTDLDIKLTVKKYSNHRIWVDITTIDTEDILSYYSYSDQNAYNLTHLVNKLSDNDEGSYRLMVQLELLPTIASIYHKM